MSNKPADDEQPASVAPSVTRLVILGLITRIITDSGVQAFFPFLGIIAQGINTSEARLGQLISLRSSTGLLAPLFGILADRRGYRLVMSLGLALAGFGYLVIAASPNWPILAIGMFMAGIGTFAFAPNLSAYLSARLPFHRRSRGLGVVEYAWAFAGILGLSLMGQLIAVTSWRVPFVILGVALLVMGVVYRQLPSAREQRTALPRPDSRGRLAHFLDLGPNRRSAWAVLAAGLFIAMTGFTFILTYGIWLQKEYQLDAAGLGRAALILGICDIIGSGLVSLIGDRLGKRRSVLVGTIGTFLGLLFLPWINSSLIGAITGLFVVRGFFEFSIVSNAVLQSEQVPGQRGKILTLGTASTLLGSTLIGFTAVTLYNVYGVLGITVSAIITDVIAFALIFFFARESG